LNHKANPSTIFVTQDFEDWLRWFLLLPEVEASMEELSNEASPGAQDTDGIGNYLKSCAFRNITLKERHSSMRPHSLNLVFTLFVDWFNPLSNKLAGKQVLLGVLALTCLNLHPSIRYKPQYTYLAGMIPAPNQPNMVTINNVLRPLVNNLLTLLQSLHIPTHQFPNGRPFTAELGVLLGDVVATHKVAGFASHLAT
jgi:hypothetical protein